MNHTSYEEFGAAFFERAVTPERVAATVRRVAGESIDVGPIKVGPGGVAVAEAAGRVVDVTARQVSTSPIRHHVRIAVSLEIQVVLAGQTHRFTGDLALSLEIAALAVTDPLQVVIDIDPPKRSDVTVRLKAAGLQARLLQRLGNMEEEIRDQVTAVVADLLEAPAAQEVRVIDIGKIIDDVWT